MARSIKIKHLFEITKNPEKQGAWLLVWSRDVPFGTNPETGYRTVALEDIEASAGASAWTTVSAAKRAAAAMVGRSRMTWSDTNGDGLTLVASFEEKLSE